LSKITRQRHLEEDQELHRPCRPGVPVRSPASFIVVASSLRERRERGTTPKKTPVSTARAME
jgi:hypothetical protein